MQADLDLMAADLLFTETTRTRQTLRDQLRMLRRSGIERSRRWQIQRSETGVDRAGRCRSPVCVGTGPLHALAVHEHRANEVAFLTPDHRSCAR